MASGVQPYAPTSARDPAGAVGAATTRSAARRFVDAAERNSFLVLAVATFALLLLNRLPATLGGDAWLMLVAAREVLEGGFPQHDMLTVWAQGERWVDQQWLAQLAFYVVHGAAGVHGLLVVNAALILAAFALGLAAARKLGAGSRSVALVGVAAVPVLVAHTAVRAQSLAYPLFVAVLALLVFSARRGASMRLLLVLPILVLWANVHGSVLVGATLVMLYAAVEAAQRLRGRVPTDWRLIAALAVSPWACVLVTPHGLDLVDYYRDTIANPAFAQLVGEWTPSSFPAQLPFLLFAGAATWLVARNPVLTPFERLAFALTLAAGFVAVRNIVWFVLLVLTVLPSAIDALWPERSTTRRRGLNLLLAAAAVVAVIVGFATDARGDRAATLGPYSDSAREALGSAIVGSDRRVFANERFADWLLWEFPDLAGRVAFDARFELLDSDELESIGRWRGRSGENWRAAARGFDLLVLDLETERDVVLSLIGDDAAWPTYSNGQLVLLVAAPPAP